MTNETKFTPGPWGRGKTSDDKVLVLGDGGNGRYVCNVQIHQTPRSMGRYAEEERLANAALIIAAPELLAMVQRLIQLVDDRRPEAEEVFDEASALLSRITAQPVSAADPVTPSDPASRDVEASR